MTILPPALQGIELAAPQSASLREWKIQLEKLVTQQRACRARKVHGALGTQLASAIRGASAAIAEACQGAESQLIDEAAGAIAPWFHHAGDARAAAKQFQAFTELRGFLRGPKGEETLSGLADQAEAVAERIGCILAGQPVWQFGGQKSLA